MLVTSLCPGKALVSLLPGQLSSFTSVQLKSGYYMVVNSISHTVHEICHLFVS